MSKKNRKHRLLGKQPNKEDISYGPDRAIEDHARGPWAKKKEG